MKMKTRKDNPGVYPPPPLFYVAVFFISIGIQHYFPLASHFFKTTISYCISILFFALGAISIFPALITFFKSKNTLVTILPANSLQTKGIYSLSRNPMYLGLLFVYIGIAFIKGNWCTFLLIPFVVVIVNRFVILNEEKYLERAFGQEYLDYANKVRRWI